MQPSSAEKEARRLFLCFFFLVFFFFFLFCAMQKVSQQQISKNVKVRIIVSKATLNLKSVRLFSVLFFGGGLNATAATAQLEDTWTAAERRVVVVGVVVGYVTGWTANTVRIYSTKAIRSEVNRDARVPFVGRQQTCFFFLKMWESSFPFVFDFSFCRIQSTVGKAEALLKAFLF